MGVLIDEDDVDRGEVMQATLPAGKVACDDAQQVSKDQGHPLQND